MSYLNDLLGKFFGNKNNDGRSTESNSTHEERPEPRFKLGEGFYFEFDEVSNGMGGYRMINVYLLKIDDPSFKRCIVDKSGMIENFPGIVDGDWKKELEFPLGKKHSFVFGFTPIKMGKPLLNGHYSQMADILKMRMALVLRTAKKSPCIPISMKMENLQNRFVFIDL